MTDAGIGRVEGANTVAQLPSDLCKQLFDSFPPVSVCLQVFGTFILWFAWYGSSKG